MLSARSNCCNRSSGAANTCAISWLTCFLAAQVGLTSASAGGWLHSLKSLSMKGRMKVTRLTLRAISSVIGFRVRRIANLLGLPVGFRLDLATGLRRGGHTFGLGVGKAIEVELHDFRRGGGLGAGDPSAPRKPDNQGRNGADGYYLQQTSAGMSIGAVATLVIGFSWGGWVTGT